MHSYCTNVQDCEVQISENSENSENPKFTLRWQGALQVILDLMNGGHLELSKIVAI